MPHCTCPVVNPRIRPGTTMRSVAPITTTVIHVLKRFHMEGFPSVLTPPSAAVWCPASRSAPSEAKALLWLSGVCPGKYSGSRPVSEQCPPSTDREGRWIDLE